MAATPKCIIDRSRPCGGCVAESPATCPYVYLLGDDRPPAVGAQAEPART